jgi:hypothetical protein
MSRDPLAVFDDAVVEAVAREHDIDAEALRDLLARHQEGMRELPGAENLVYEWRKAFPWEVVLERRDDAYLTDVREGVWPEFADALGFGEADLAAVMAVHARQVEADSDADATEGDPLVVTRE